MYHTEIACHYFADAKLLILIICFLAFFFFVFLFFFLLSLLKVSAEFINIYNLYFYFFLIPQIATYPVNHMRCVSSVSSRRFDVQSFMVCVSHCLNDIHCLAITYIKRHKECRMSRDEMLFDCVLSNGDGSFTRSSRRKCMFDRQVF